jgi:hypothetical protein
MMLMKEDVLLSSSVTIAKYRQFGAGKNRERIADFIMERFTERYIRPLRGDPTKKHGFCTMAICCLMIEALESFWQGWPDTKEKGKSREAFNSFFQRCSEQELELGIFSKLAEDFYQGVRCGILHQAETTKGWRIRREGPLFDPHTKTINATRFHNELEKALRLYCDILKQSDWDSEVWQNLRRKMEVVIKNCRPGAA